MVNLHRNQADIICKAFCHCELLNLGDQLFAELVSVKASSLTHSSSQPELIVILPIGPFDLEKPVAKEQQYVSRAQLAGPTMTFCFIKDPEHRVGLRPTESKRLSA